MKHLSHQQTISYSNRSIIFNGPQKRAVPDVNENTTPKGVTRFPPPRYFLVSHGFSALGFQKGPWIWDEPAFFRPFNAGNKRMYPVLPDSG
ncbi:hypothetical protein FKM82_004127 [Ascaphus truei]